jgi:flagellar protein FlaG
MFELKFKHLYSLRGGISMSSTPIGNTSSNPTSADRTYPTNTSASRIPIPNASYDPTNADLVQVQSVKELKQITLKGDNVPLGEEQVIKAIERANKALIGASTTCEFSIHKATKAIMVKVIDKDSGEVLIELPPEKILDMVASMCKQSGIIIDEKR